MNLKHLTREQTEVANQRKAQFRQLIQHEVERLNGDISIKRLTKKQVVKEILRMNFGTPINEFMGLKKGEKKTRVIDKVYATHEITLDEIENKIVEDVFFNNPSVSERFLHLSYRNHIRYFAYMAILKENEDGINFRDEISRVEKEYKGLKQIERCKILHYRFPTVSIDRWKKRIQRLNPMTTKNKKGTL